MNADPCRYEAHYPDEHHPEIILIVDKLESSRLNLGDIEHIVYDTEQGIARVLDVDRVCPDAFVYVVPEDQVRHAYDGIHGSPDLVRHVREEHTLLEIGFLRLFPGFLCFP